MSNTRYSESRTLVRRLRRLPGESREDFRGKVRRLRKQFAQFNVNVSELCQWLMSLRPGGKRGSDRTKEFWEFFLEPDRFLGNPDDDRCDACRLAVFDVAAGLAPADRLGDFGVGEALVESVHAIGQIPLTPTAAKLFTRLRGFEASHRQVLLKAAAEWIVAHYLRGYENWVRRHEEWEKEKARWEASHSELTQAARDDFDRIFKDLGIERKRPRVCTGERLKANKDDCDWAGERIPVGRAWRNHSSLCVKYWRFLKEYPRKAGIQGQFKKLFVTDAETYMDLRRTSRGDRSVTMAAFLRKQRNAQSFPEAWEAYLKALEVNEQTVLAAGHGLPHCTGFGPDADCQFNKHTADCERYRRALDARPDLLPLEKLYRHWRREYLSGPGKPCFQYPSQRKLPMPKIFGKGYFRVDLAGSVLELRLEGGGDFEQFRIAVWPSDYTPKAQDAQITSVHISFVGTRARAGFRFEVPHKASRFAVGQDQIDELRSRKYPRRAQDAEFLKEARMHLLESFAGDAEHDVRVLAVDLGTSSGAAAVFRGRSFEKAMLLKVIKLEERYDSPPKENRGDGPEPSEEEKKKARARGLRPAHVGRHLESWALAAREIAIQRGKEVDGPATLGDHDLRRFSLHIRWMIRDWVRLNVSQIIEAAEGNHVDLIVFESMRGWRLPGYDKVDDERKRRLAFWAHGRIRHKVREKAVERGMRVVTVPYFKSSQFCGSCGTQQQDIRKLKTNKRERTSFTCESCGHRTNSDENAAQVLAKVFWGDVVLPEEPDDCS